MIKRRSRHSVLKAGVASFVLSVGLAAGPAIAQTALAEAEQTTAEGEGDIVVTGSLIRNPNLTLSSPVNATTSEQIELKQSNNAEELIREIPGVVAATGPAVNISNPGSSFINLRGLGENRNLVLLDGVRLVPSGLGGQFDLNNIPLALIERVDLLTGGASTTYGADAISGVVNFVTKSRFTGLELSASSQITEEGDGNRNRVELTGGTDFAGGRGNIILSVGYQNTEPVYQGDRSFSAIPLNSRTGTFAGSAISIPASFSLPGTGLRQVQGDELVPQYQNFNGNTHSLFQNAFERYNVYGAASFDITDSVEIYARGLYSNNTVDVFAAHGGAFNLPVQLPISNPFLSDAQRNTFCSANGITPAACTAAAAATSPSDPNYRTVNTVMSRRVTEFGIRNNETTTDYYDFRAGLRGDITSTIGWDFYGAYGESERTVAHRGYGLGSRINQSLQAIMGANGTPVCIDMSNNCVPINWFGPANSFTPEQAGFITEEWVEGQRVSLLQFNGKVNGDIGWSLPWATNPVSFGAGAEYRRYRASQFADALSQSGDITGSGGAVLPFRGGYSVWELVAEVNVPIIQDRPFFHELTLEGGVRYSRYTIAAPNDPSYNTTTWKAGGSWAPVEGARLRGTYARAVRAPNIEELFAPQSTVPGTLVDDPCANINDQGDFIPGRPAPSGALRDTCIAQGAPVSQIGFIQVPTGREVNTTIGGNVNAGPEESDSYTLGVVLTPVSRLTLSVDYYNITVTGAITTPTELDAISACFTNPSAASEACTNIRRDPLTGSLRGSLSTVRGLFLGLSNLGRLETDGIDVTVNYQHGLGPVDWSILGTFNWTNKSVFQATPTSEVRDCVGVFNTGCDSLQPEFQWSVRNTFAIDPVDVSILWRHIDSLQSTEPLFAGTIPGLGNVDFNRLPAYDIFDLTVRARVGERFTLTAGIQNLFDKQPPLVGGNAGTFAFNGGNTFPSTYDILGRRFIISATARF